MGRLVAVLGLALALRAALFPFAENKHGDAPMRALVAERMVIDPASAAVPRTYCQFGPLHTTLMRPFIALDRYAPRSTRYLSFLAGLAVFWPFWLFARRLVGRERAELATLALAVSPLHLQAATTAASEALYLLLWVGAIERLLTALDFERSGGRPPTRRFGTFALAGVLASLAAVTRYDAWLALPIMAAAAFRLAPNPRAALPGLLLFSGLAAVLPVGWLVWGAVAGGDPLFFAHYISADHAGLAATAAARYGVVLGRLRQLGIWTIAFAAAMTPPGMLFAGRALAGWRSLSRSARFVALAALAPPALYLARGLLLMSFEPLARFGLVPGTLLLPLAAGAVPLGRTRAFRVATVGLSAAFALAIWAVATWAHRSDGDARIWAGAESMGALTRMDDEDRALAQWLRARRPPGALVMIEPLAFADIAIAHAAGIPWTESISLIVTRDPGPSVVAARATTGAKFMVGYDHDGGWPRRLPDWPRDATAIGHWRVVEP